MTINISKIAELVETVELTEDDLRQNESGYTGFAIATIINKTLVELGAADQQIPPQMMYGYIRNGRINGVKKQMRYSEQEVETFVAKFVKIRISK
jgi:hypothetical protein